MRLTDLGGLYQADAAERMGVSRQTIGNLLNSAHRKVADALLNGKALRIRHPSAGRFAGQRSGRPVGRCAAGRVSCTLSNSLPDTP